MSAERGRARRRRGPPRRARLPPGAQARPAALRHAALGFAGISPVVGLYAVVLVGTAVAGPAWIWVLPVALAGQCLLLAVYSELASEFPIAGGAYQWSRRLLGGSLRLVQRLGRALRLRRREHDDRLPRRALAADPARDRADADGDRLRRDGADRRAARRSARSGSTSLGRVVRAGIARRGARLGRDRDRAAARLPRPGPLDPRRHARRRGALGRLGRSRRCWPRSRSAAGSSSASTARSASPRRPATRPATCRGRSGSRCSASACW